MTTVYIIEDEQLLRDFMKDMLAGRDDLKIVGDSANAETALVACRELRPDMIVTDARLPGMDGVDLAAKLREILPGLRVLLVSGLFSPAIIRRALMTKIDGILEKSSGLAEMEKAMLEVAQGHNYYGDAILKSLPELISGGARVHPVDSLTSREKEILCMIADGLSTREIAEKLEISARTADVHRMHIMTKLDAHNVASLTRIAIASGLVDIAIV